MIFLDSALLRATVNTVEAVTLLRESEDRDAEERQQQLDQEDYREKMEDIARYGRIHGF